MSSTIKQAIEALKNRVADAYTAVANKGGTLPTTQDSANLPAAINSIPSGGGGGYTGHVDEVGLRAIGWRTSDIEWLQDHIDWMAEEDDAYKVPQELIDIYTANGGWDNTLLFAHKSQPYFTWSPYFDTTGITIDASHLRHNNAYYMIGMPRFEFFSRLGNSYNMFANCYSLKFINDENAANITGVDLSNCSSLKRFGMTGGAGTSVTLYGCYSLEQLPDNTSGYQIKILNSTKLTNFKIYRCYGSCSFAGIPLLTKESLIYAITNASTSGTITIALTAERYTTLSADADVITALTNKGNVVIASV